MNEAKFSIGEALKYGWESFKAKTGFFIGLTVAVALIAIIPDLIADKLFHDSKVLLFISQLILRVLGLFVGMVTTRISLDLYDNGDTDLAARIPELLPQVPMYLVGKILYGVIVLIGLILLVVPGIILSFMLLYVGYLMIDRHLGPIEALKLSKEVTAGSKWKLFLFSLVIALVNLAGVVALVVGLLVTVPVTLMASAYVYRQLSPKPEAAVA